MLKMTVDGKQAEAMFDGLLSGLEDLSPAWPQVERIVMDMEREQFKTEGGYGGEKWEPLNKTYAEYKQMRYGNKPILQATGVLMGSLTTKGQGHYYASGPNFVEVGTTVPYGAYHQRGHESPTRLPKRTVVPVPNQDTGAKIADVILAFLLKKMRLKLTTGK